MRPRIQPQELPQSNLFPKIKRYLWGLGIGVAGIVLGYYLITTYIFYYIPEALPQYTIRKQHTDDSLRIAFIGDSWADYHTLLGCDSMVKNIALSITDIPVKTATRGKKGALSKEIYFFMYSNKTEEHSYEPDRCTQPLIEDAPDYCVVFAGINDVTFLRPTNFYTENMRYIISLLLHNKIRPVIMEIPIVNFSYPMPQFRFRERWFYRIRSLFMGTWNNEGSDYNNALRKMLSTSKLKDSVLYISANKWNPKGCLDTTIFLDDRLHLNLNGYHKLDSCITTEIIRDYLKKKKL